MCVFCRGQRSGGWRSTRPRRARTQTATPLLDICRGVRAGGKVQLEGAPHSRLGLDAGYHGRSLYDWHTVIRSQHRIDRGAVLQCFPTLWESPKYSLRRRTVDESSYRVGMGDRPPAELGTSTTRTSAVGCTSGRWIFT